MNTYTVNYKAVWGNFTSYNKTIRAYSAEQAERKFWSSPESDNCLYIISINRVNHLIYR